MTIKQTGYDVKWFAKADLTKYENKYVAIVNRQIVASSEDPGIAYRKASKAHKGKEIILWKALGSESLILCGVPDVYRV